VLQKELVGYSFKVSAPPDHIIASHKLKTDKMISMG